MKNERLYKRLYYLWNDLLALIDMHVETDMKLRYDSQNIKHHRAIHGNINYQGVDLDFAVTLINDVDMWFHCFDDPFDFHILVRENGDYDLDAKELSEDVTAEDINDLIKFIEEEVKSYSDDLAKANETMINHDRFEHDLSMAIAEI